MPSFPVAHLQDVHEIGTAIALDHLLLLGQSIKNVVALAGPPLGILSTEGEMHEQGTAE